MKKHDKRLAELNGVLAEANRLWAYYDVSLSSPNIFYGYNRSANAGSKSTCEIMFCFHGPTHGVHSFSSVGSNRNEAFSNALGMVIKQFINTVSTHK